MIELTEAGRDVLRANARIAPRAAAENAVSAV
jgi:hypothetical protein